LLISTGLKAAAILTTKIYWKSSLLKTTSPPPSGAARHNILYSAKPKIERGRFQRKANPPFTICPDSLLKERDREKASSAALNDALSILLKVYF